MRKKVFKKAAVLFSVVLLFGLSGCNKPVDTDGESDGKRIEVKAVVEDTALTGLPPRRLNSTRFTATRGTRS